MSPMSPQKSRSGGRNLTGPHSINHRGGGTAWYGFGTGLVHPETMIITNGYGVWYTGTPWRPYEGVPHPKPVSAAFVAPVTPPMPFENPLLSASFRAQSNLLEPFRTINCFSDVFPAGPKKLNLVKPNQAYESLLKPSNILGVLRLLLFNPVPSSRHHPSTLPAIKPRGRFRVLIRLPPTWPSLIGRD